MGPLDVLDAIKFYRAGEDDDDGPPFFRAGLLCSRCTVPLTGALPRHDSIRAAVCCLAEPLPPTEAEENAQEDELRHRFGLPERGFCDPVLRDDDDWGREGALRAVLDEPEQLSKRRRYEEDNDGSVRFARGFAFALAVKHNSADVVQHRNAATRAQKHPHDVNDFYLSMAMGETMEGEARVADSRVLNERAVEVGLDNNLLLQRDEQTITGTQHFFAERGGPRQVAGEAGEPMEDHAPLMKVAVDSTRAGDVNDMQMPIVLRQLTHANRTCSLRFISC